MSQNESQYENMMCAAECIAEALRECMTAMIAGAILSKDRTSSITKAQLDDAVALAKDIVKQARK